MKRHSHRERSRTVYQTLLFPLLLVVLLQTILLGSTLFSGGIVRRLNQNSAELFCQQAENRRNYLENDMASQWGDLSPLAAQINTITAQMVADGTLDLDTLNSGSEACLPLLTEIAPLMISDLYAKQVTGIFVVFNTQDLNPLESGTSLPGLYLRDLDPGTRANNNSDLLLVRAPIDLVKSLDIPTDSSWQPLFRYPGTKKGFFYLPFETAYQDEVKMDAVNYGYWTTSSYTMGGDNRPAISYSLPLILEDGTVYGVLGIELLDSYLQKQLPHQELQNNDEGTYLLGTVPEDYLSEDSFESECAVYSTGTYISGIQDGLTLTRESDGSYRTEIDGSSYYVSLLPITLYNNYAPFTHQQWVLVSLIREQTLFSFSDQVLRLLLTAMFLAAAASVIGVLYVSRRVSKPIARLSCEVSDHQGRSDLPSFSSTGIREIDTFSSEITSLSREVINTSTKFLRIIDMASVDLAGYELCDGEDYIYVTENFFSLLGMNDIDQENLTAVRFHEILNQVELLYHSKRSFNGNTTLRIPAGPDQYRYICLKAVQEGSRQFGVLEDVTGAMQERLHIERERDYDALTGLYSRRAFQRECAHLFAAAPGELKHGALVMFDLDNLKYINDNFGHDWGDQYIRQAAQCFLENTPEGTLRSRVSGDEFFLFFHGYDSREELRGHLKRLSEALHQNILGLPSGRQLPISASGGIAWYPEDASEWTLLKKYADFAMYQVKQSGKGKMGEFDPEEFRRDAAQNELRREFHQLLKEELVHYHFQPIFSAASGDMFAAEALMRVNLPALKSPEEVMQLARTEGCLHEVERLTLFRASEAFQTLRKERKVPSGVVVFINSIASEYLNRQQQDEYFRLYADLIPNIVIELIETEYMDPEATQIKREALGNTCRFALDDYGTGYNSEKNLLDLNPTFIKVDLSIIRDIDTSRSKQQIVANIVSYAHSHHQYIIAEGIETASELRKVLSLGVDYLQGYFLARPAEMPHRIHPEALEVIREFHAD